MIGAGEINLLDAELENNRKVAVLMQEDDMVGKLEYRLFLM